MSHHDTELDALLYTEEMLLFQKELLEWEEYDIFVKQTLDSYSEEKSLIENINKEDARESEGEVREPGFNDDGDGTSNSGGTSDWYNSYLRSIEEPKEGEDRY